MNKSWSLFTERRVRRKRRGDRKCGGCAAFCWLWRQGSLEGLEGGLWERRAGGARVNSKDIQSQDPDSASHLNFPRAPAEEPCWPAT